MDPTIRLAPQHSALQHWALQHSKASAGLALLGVLLLTVGCDSRALQLRLERAVLDGDSGAVQAALGSGADPSLRVENNLAPVTNAAYAGHVEIARLLIEAGADLDPRCRPNVICKPLHHAAEHGHAELTRLLLEAGADPDSRGPYGDTALLYALAANQLETSRILLELGADPNEPNVSGATGFGGICGLGHSELVPLALTNGGDLEARTDFGSYENFTPLMLAAAGGHLEVVEQLLEAGAEPSARTESSATAAMLAEEGGHLEVAALLEEHSGSP